MNYTTNEPLRLRRLDTKNTIMDPFFNFVIDCYHYYLAHFFLSRSFLYDNVVIFINAVMMLILIVFFLFVYVTLFIQAWVNF